MAAYSNEPRPTEPTEKRIVEVAADGTIVSSEPLETAPTHVATQPAPVMQAPQPQVIQVKRGGNSALMVAALVLVLAVGGLGFYIYQTRDDTVARQQAELQVQQQQIQLEQQRSVTQEKLQELGQAADDLGAQVRDTQRDLGIPATPAPATTAPATTTTAPATTTTTPAAPVQPQVQPQPAPQ